MTLPCSARGQHFGDGSIRTSKLRLAAEADVRRRCAESHLCDKPIAVCPVHPRSYATRPGPLVVSGRHRARPLSQISETAPSGGARNKSDLSCFLRSPQEHRRGDGGQGDSHTAVREEVVGHRTSGEPVPKQSRQHRDDPHEHGHRYGERPCSRASVDEQCQQHSRNDDDDEQAVR